MGEDIEQVGADCGDRANAGRVQQIPAPHHQISRGNVRAAASDVLSWRCGGENGDVGVIDARRFLEHHHRIGAVGHRRPGGNLGARAAGDSVGGRLPGEHSLGDREADRRIAGGADRIGGDHRVAVHHGTSERRNEHVSRHVGGGDAADGVQQRYALGSRHRSHMLREQAPRLVDRNRRLERSQIVKSLDP